MKENKLKKKEHIYLFFCLCFLVYFTTYLGRLNYAASLAEIINTENFSRGSAGLIGTAFFFSYGIGQFLNGFIGDYINSKYMVFLGLFISGLMNAIMGSASSSEVMTVVWCLNGFAQSMIWSPLLKSICDNLQVENQRRFCMYINYSVPLGTLTAYALTAFLINNNNWHVAFFVPSVIIIAIAIIWLLCMGYIEKITGNNILVVQEENNIPIVKGSMKNIFIQSGLIFVGIALLVQGALKDSVTTWIPVYLIDNYNIGNIVAILSTIVIPICNLFGVSFAVVVEKKTKGNEVLAASIFYCICGLSLLALWGLNGKSVVVSIALLAIATTVMMSVNSLLIAVLPSRFGKIGRASSVSGILNSSVYAGCAGSTYGIGVLSERFGWDKVILLWVAGAFLAFLICLFTSRKWREYVNTKLDKIK
ncbi:MAG: MFS transporter [Lachnospirales bacterium]